MTTGAAGRTAAPAEGGGGPPRLVVEIEGVAEGTDPEGSGAAGSRREEGRVPAEGPLAPARDLAVATLR